MFKSGDKVEVSSRTSSMRGRKGIVVRTTAKAVIVKLHGKKGVELWFDPGELSRLGGER